MAERVFLEKFNKKMKKIYIKESQLELLNESNINEEVTFYDFFVNVKSFLKDLMKKPYESKPSNLFLNIGVCKDELISKMKDINLIVGNEKIIEVPKDGENKKVAKHIIQYKIPKNRFKDKLKSLYKEFFSESINKPQVFDNTDDIIKNMLKMDSDNAYKKRGGFDKTLVSEDGEGGATSCGNVMQGGGSNPSAGQYDMPFKNIQKRDFWKPALTRNKDEKNKSISMNRKS